MAQQTMYPGKINSPMTALASGITSSVTSIPLVSASALPPAPNICTIGIEEDAETIFYTGISTNTLTGVTRGLQGTAKTWDSNSPVSRMFTEKDYATIIANISDLQDSLDLKAPKVNDIPYVVGTQTVTTASWTGAIDTVDALYDGLSIRYWLPRTSSSNVTLNLTLKGGGTTGAIPCYYGGTTRLTTQYPAGSFIMLTYIVNQLINGVAYTGWWAKANYVDGTESYTVRWNSTHMVGAPLYSYKLAMFGTDGLLYPLTLETGTGTTKTISTVEFAIDSPLLYYGTTTTIATNGTSSSYWYTGVTTSNLNYTANKVSGWISYKPIYLRGTITASGNFKLDNTSYTSFMTQDLPTTEDGFVYMLIGYMYNTTTAIRLTVHNPIIEFKDGKIRPYLANHTHPYEPSFTKNAAFNKDFGITEGTVTQGNDSRLSDARTPSAHTHQATEVTESGTKRFVTDTEKTTWNNKGTSNLALGELSTNAYQGDKGKTAYDHSQATHAPTTAQKNSDITKAEIEAKLTGAITTHTHASGAPIAHATTHITGGGDVISNSVAGGNSGLMTGADKAKLDGVATSANNYTHPTTSGNKHVPTGGTSGNYLKYSADGTAVWGTPVKADVGLSNVDNTTDANKPVSTATTTALNLKADKTQVLTNVPIAAIFTDTIYTHPANHLPSDITQDANNRFVTDTEKSAWNAKSNVKITVSATEPGEKASGDFWFKEI